MRQEIIWNPYAAKTQRRDHLDSSFVSQAVMACWMRVLIRDSSLDWRCSVRIKVAFCIKSPPLKHMLCTPNNEQSKCDHHICSAHLHKWTHYNSSIIEESFLFRLIEVSEFFSKIDKENKSCDSNHFKTSKSSLGFTSSNAVLIGHSSIFRLDFFRYFTNRVASSCSSSSWDTAVW